MSKFTHPDDNPYLGGTSTDSTVTVLGEVYEMLYAITQHLGIDSFPTEENAESNGGKPVDSIGSNKKEKGKRT